MLAFLSPQLVAKDVLSIDNEFIKITVNDKDAKGRFALQTSFGDPLNENDDSKELIYGQPLPWTSYTSFLINGKAYIFGNKDKRLERRSRKSFHYLPIKKQFIDDNSIISVAELDGLEIWQSLSFFRNPSTLVNDSMKISYELRNMSNSTQNVAMRLMLDTKLGENDGAPLRMGEHAVPSEIQVQQSDLYSYWQAFDSLSSPNIIAQGLLQDFSKQLTLPTYIHLANWGTLADSEWDVAYKKGRSFIREGEKEKDTALALYYEAQDVSANQSLTLSTVYGLGGLSLAPGALSAGLTAAKQVPGNSAEPFLVLGYLLNASGYDSHHTKAEFTVPNDFTVVQGNLISTFNTLEAGVQKQIPLLLKTNSSLPKRVPITFSISSDTFESNSITRYVEILGKPIVNITGSSLVQSRAEGPYHVLTGTLRNPTPLAIKDLSITMSANFDYDLASFESKEKHIPVLKAYETQPFSWAFKLKAPQDDTAIRITLRSKQSGETSQRIPLNLKAMTSRLLSLIDRPESSGTSEYVSLRLQLPATGAAYELDYDTSLLRYVRASTTAGSSATAHDGGLRLKSQSDTAESVIIHFKKQAAFFDTDIHLKKDATFIETLSLKLRENDD